MTFQDMIRTANEHNLALGDWPYWRESCEMRARPNHTYDQETAHTVVASIPTSVQEAIHLCNKLREHLRRVSPATARPSILPMDNRSPSLAQASNRAQSDTFGLAYERDSKKVLRLEPRIGWRKTNVA